MAKLSGKELQFTGTIKNLTAYTMRGHDGIVIRHKNGPSKRHIQKNPEFEATRNLNSEWRGVCMGSTDIRHGLSALKNLADFNISGPLNALVKKIQVEDTVNPKGKRSILFSRQPDFLGSFQYNRQTIFDSIIRQPLEVHIDKTTAVVDVIIPPLQSLINFFPNPRYAYFRIVLACTGLSDYTFLETSKDYSHENGSCPAYDAQKTEWAIAKVSQYSTSIQLTPKLTFRTGPDTIILAGAGIQYGMPGVDGSIQPVPFAGAARLLKGV